MALEVARDAEQVLAAIRASDQPVVVGFFAGFSAASSRAQPAFERACAAHPGRPAFLVDVERIRDLHARLGVTAVPTVQVHRGDRLLRSVLGAQAEEHYARVLFAEPAPHAAAGETAAPAHRVTVYTTPTCAWCTRTKSYLRQHHVAFREVDVSSDDAAARRMVARSGRQGVPQIDIDGRMIVGFDRPTIDELLGLTAGAGA